ncbi:alpha-1,2-fucosyltransferase [Gammaproteobacteria bacterium]|nr:alpha-1,2-fucosyltransferase [Gammaproteobacteria bacterium]
MNIIKLTGGLGNQLFQYAFGQHLARKEQCEVFYDISSFNNQPDFLDKRKFELSCIDLKIPIINDNNFNNFQALSRNKKIVSSFKHLIYGSKGDFLRIPENLTPISNFLPHYIHNKYYSGYWQTYKYLQSTDMHTAQGFNLKKEYENQLLNTHYKKEINSSNSISLQVRRGDYLNVGNVICDLDYYQKSVRYFANKISNPVYFVFSDDIEWCRRELDLDAQLIFLEPNLQLPFEDMKLMSLCKHHIIVNSSYGWWGGMLNHNNRKIIVSPKRWKNKLNLKSFIKI